ncbi:MAG: hypothetical protein H6698_03430 [Myxococcales bacterium]|nr:hypothetical protein [Myxococcales bacterium]MCB9519297.1 hypothetical protein [Myxococcales bacterium]MCB9530741.1 hypothetical protein [Myxococcales bacterium]MCB9533365.1 hypothetical protein [Myxococcales bacterium]
MRLRRLGARAALATLLLGGCAADDTPPFRIREYGAGLDVSTAGRRVELVDSGGHLWGKLRVSRGAVRVYDGDARRLGTGMLRSGAASVTRVDGSVLCEGAYADDRIELRCDGQPLAAAAVPSGGLELRDASAVIGRVEPRGGRAVALAGATGAEVAVAEGAQLELRTHPDAILRLTERPGRGLGDAAALAILALPVRGASEADARLVTATIAVWWASRSR